MKCFWHNWSEWGPPYEAEDRLPSRSTFQQKICTRCKARRKRRIGSRGHIAAMVPAPEANLLEAPVGCPPPEVIDPPRRRRP